MHYHGPGGLNGRVRDGNGWDPASIVAGIRSDGFQAVRSRWFPIGWSHIHQQLDLSLVARSFSHVTFHPADRGRHGSDHFRLSLRSAAGPVGVAAADRGGQAVGC